MRIIKRIPEEPFAYTELEFESLEEYEAEYPKFIEAYKRMVERNKELKKTVGQKLSEANKTNEDNFRQDLNN